MLPSTETVIREGKKVEGRRETETGGIG